MTNRLVIITGCAVLSIASFTAGLWLGHNPPAIAPASLGVAAAAPGKQGGTSEQKQAEPLERQVLRLERELASLKARSQLQAALRASLQPPPAAAELPPTDEPAAWPSETPERFLEPSFTRLMADATRATGNGTELVGVSCDEPPCIAMFRLPRGAKDDDSAWLKRLQTTAAWAKNYDNGIGLMQTTVACEDGHREAVALIAKGADEWSEEVKFITQQRVSERFDALRSQWRCANPNSQVK